MTVQEAYDHDPTTQDVALEPDPPTLSFVFCCGGKPFSVSPVAEDTDKPRGVQRIRIDSGPVAVFVMREDIPELVAALMRAMEA